MKILICNIVGSMAYFRPWSGDGPSTSQDSRPNTMNTVPVTPPRSRQHQQEIRTTPRRSPRFSIQPRRSPRLQIANRRSTSANSPTHHASSSSNKRTQFPYKISKGIQCVVRNVFSYFMSFSESTEQAIRYTEKATTLSYSTIRKYCVVNKDIINTPGKTRQGRGKWQRVDGFTLGVIRRCVYRLYAAGKSPTLDTILKKLKDETRGTSYFFSYGRTILREILLKLGFKWKKSMKNRKILMESYRLRMWRFKYLQQIKQAKEENKTLIYLDETWFNVGESASYIWTDGTLNSTQKAPVSRGERLIILHAGSADGWVPNALLILRTKGTGSFDYHQDMDSHNFEKWLEEQLFPNIPPNSAIVMDNAPYHSRKSQKIPRTNNNKTEIVEWLDQHNIPHGEKTKTLKAELLKLVKESGITDKYAVDELCKTNGHTVIRLPPYHCHLNPIELAWSQTKSYLRRDAVTTNAAEAIDKVKEAVTTVTPQKWKNCCDHVQKESGKHIENELIAECIQEDVVIDLLEIDSDSDSEDNEDNDEVNVVFTNPEVEDLQLEYPDIYA